jgi:hypothetical protein
LSEAGAAAEAATIDPQALLDYAQTLIGGEEPMFIMDVPSMPATEVPLLLAQTSAPSAARPADFVFKACTETQPTPDDPTSAMRGVNPAYMLRNYYASLGREIDLAKINISLVQGTKHGKLTTEIGKTGLTSYRYDPLPGFLGDDQVVFMAEYGGNCYKIILDIKVLETIDESNPICPEPKLIKIKKPASGSSGYGLDGISVSFVELPTGALGQTTGTTITLDDNAAGHGWFIDLTPTSNEEFLPTADPTVWKARPGSEAAGRMDMLSVLLHEYGHALGLDHSADSHDYMAATLQPGERRMLSADDQLALMQLTGYFPTPDSPMDPFSPFLGTPLLFGLGRLRGTVTDLFTTSDNAGEANTRARLPQYEVVANPTLTNPEFAGSTGWSTTGTVSLGNGAAVLTESATAQTRLNQLFVLGEHDRFLRFTLSDIALDDPSASSGRTASC